MSDHRPVTVEAAIDRIMDMRNAEKPSLLEIIKKRTYAEGYDDGYDSGYKEACDESIEVLLDLRWDEEKGDK